MLLLGGALLLTGLTAAGLPLVVAKAVTDVLLAVVSYVVQRAVVFARRPVRRAEEEIVARTPALLP